MAKVRTSRGFGGAAGDLGAHGQGSVTTLFVATIGGHLAQLEKLSERISTDGGSLWVTNPHAQSSALLASRDVEYVPYIGSLSVSGVLRAIPHAHRLLRRHRITRAVSTGSAIALAYLPYLALRGVECHYIESATRVSGPSVTGRLLRWAPFVHTHTQYPHWSHRGWHYGGSGFDVYRAESHDGHELGETVRVVVTLGTMAEYPFGRLIGALAELLQPDGELSAAIGRPVEVLWQTGGTPVRDLPIVPTPFLPAGELSAALRAADIVIAHAGTGSALAALDAGRLPIVVPRSRRFGEIGDAHQQQLAAELGRRRLAHVIADPARITVDDLLATLGTRVVKCATPQPFSLSPK